MKENLELLDLKTLTEGRLQTSQDITRVLYQAGLEQNFIYIFLPYYKGSNIQKGDTRYI